MQQHNPNQAFSETWNGTPNLAPVEETDETPVEQSAKALHEMDPEEFRAHSAAMWADRLPQLRPAQSIADLIDGARDSAA